MGAAHIASFPSGFQYTMFCASLQIKAGAEPGICAGEGGDLCGRRRGFVREKAGICMGESGYLRREKTGAAAEKNGNHAGDRMDKNGRIVYKKVWWRKAMYTFESRVRYSELDENGRLSLEGIMNYFQD